MRALVLLCLVGLSFFLVVTYYPDSSIEASEPDDAASLAALQLEQLQEPEAEPEAVAPVASNPFLSESAQPAKSIEKAGEDWLSGVAVARGMSPGELAVASALVHGGTRGVSSVLSRNREFPSSKALLAEAVALTLERKFEDAMERARQLNPEELSAREQELLKLSLRGTGLESIRSSSQGGALELALEMSLCAFAGEEALSRREYASAARAFSSVILAELDSPWEADTETLERWTNSLHEAQRSHRWNPKGDWPAVEMEVQPGESPIAVRLRFLNENPGKIMCTGLFLKANGLASHIIQPGQSLRLPTDPVSVLVDLSARWALFMMGGEVVGSWPVGVGAAQHDTPIGEYTAGNKLENPPWMRVGHEPVPFGDERNPLGTRWIGWFREGVKTSYGLHGTKDPSSIGTPSSLGCVRFLNSDIELLFNILPLEAAIYVRD